MIPSQYLTIGKWLAVVALVGTVYITIRNHGHAIAENAALHDKLDAEIELREQAEAERDEMANKLLALQEIDRQREIEEERIRQRSSRAMRELQDLRNNQTNQLWLDTMVPAELVDRVRETANDLQVPHSAQ
jgi:phosphoglycolate phosphatase-like HAD superfamily hydrolase